MGKYENRPKRKHIRNEGRKVSGLRHNKRWNKARPSKNRSGNEKLDTKRPRSDTAPIPTASKHRQVYNKISGTHASHLKSSLELRYGKRTQLDERGRRSLPKDKKKVAKIANTKHAKGGGSANTLLTTKEMSGQMDSRDKNIYISYVQTNKPEGQIVNKFLKQKELLPHMLKGKEEGALRQSNELQARLAPTPRAWRLYLSKEAGKEGSGVGMIQLGPDENFYSYAIRLNFDTLATTWIMRHYWKD
ncbi:hypothetical protein Tco_1273513 [Tanacetum coccineum]